MRTCKTCVHRGCPSTSASTEISELWTCQDLFSACYGRPVPEDHPACSLWKCSGCFNPYCGTESARLNDDTQAEPVFTPRQEMEIDKIAKRAIEDFKDGVRLRLVEMEQEQVKRATIDEQLRVLGEMLGR